MELGLNRIPGHPLNRYHPANINKQKPGTGVEAFARQAQAASARQTAEKVLSQEDVEKYLKDIIRMSSLFNRRLKYSVNSELRQVTVKVIDRETDNVIKELPPEALQKLHRNMREALGVLIDQQI